MKESKIGKKVSVYTLVDYYKFSLHNLASTEKKKKIILLKISINLSFSILLSVAPRLLSRGGSRGRVQGVCIPPPPEITFSFLSDITSILQHLFTSSVTSFLSGARPPKKYPGSAPTQVVHQRISPSLV